VFLLSVSLPAICAAGILWDGEFDEFRFAIEKNGGTFLYEPEGYLKPSLSDTDECRYSPTQSILDAYDCVAVGELGAFAISAPGNLFLDAMAMGPDSGANPSDGLKVQGYLEAIPVNLSADHGVDAEQKVVVWVSRHFSVDREGQRSLGAVLDGEVEFDDFESGPYHKASYTVYGEVTLEEIADGIIQMMPGFPLSLTPSNANVLKNVMLRPENEIQQSVSYQLKITLNLESDIVNFTLADGEIQGVIDGSFQLGTENLPFTLQATISERRAAPWLHLLLLDE
jgi:hypothetical protein